VESSSYGDKDEEEREKRRREKRANEFRKACRSIWFALLAAKDELFSIDMDDIGSVNDALRTSTFVMNTRKLRKERRKAIADAKRQKEMLAYSDDDDDDDDGDERGRGSDVDASENRGATTDRGRGRRRVRERAGERGGDDAGRRRDASDDVDVERDARDGCVGVQTSERDDEYV